MQRRVCSAEERGLRVSLWRQDRPRERERHGESPSSEQRSGRRRGLSAAGTSPTRHHLAAVTCLALLVSFGSGTLAAAAVGKGEAEIHGCVSEGGQLTIVKPGQKCGKHKTPIIWSVRGPQGAAGPQGSAGAQGAAGAQGLQGATGERGGAGTIGPQGVQGPTGPHETSGPTGPTGAQGVQGATGPQGAQGPTGAQGVAGATGPQGPQGATGPAGVQGATGPQGVAGPTGTKGATGERGATGEKALRECREPRGRQAPKEPPENGGRPGKRLSGSAGSHGRERRHRRAGAPGEPEREEEEVEVQPGEISVPIVERNGITVEGECDSGEGPFKESVGLIAFQAPGLYWTRERARHREGRGRLPTRQAGNECGHLRPGIERRDGPHSSGGYPSPRQKLHLRHSRHTVGRARAARS